MYKKIIVFSVIILIGLVISTFMKDGVKDLPGESSEQIDENILTYFKENATYEKIILCKQEDVNNDSKKDLVVIYSKDKQINEMVVVASKGDNYYISKPVRAPKENQIISFKNIDNKDEIEIVISGSKNGNIGYAIYRLQEDVLIDLFGEGMQDCC